MEEQQGTTHQQGEEILPSGSDLHATTKAEEIKETSNKMPL